VNTIDVRIRLAEGGDFEAIVSLINANFPNDPPIDKETIASWIADGGHLIVAAAPHGVVGFVRMDSERRGLFHLAVVPELRNQGLGRLLVANVEDSARQLGWLHVLLGVDNATPGLVGYYESLGYNLRADVQPIVAADGSEDPVRKLIMMEKILLLPSA
jgi:ribosomal protein S18 acetylase RimI-like enzyme